MIEKIIVKNPVQREIKGAVIKYRTEGGGGGGGVGLEDFVKTCEKIAGPNILASENPIHQQKWQHKFHAPTKSTPVSLRQ